MCTWGFAKIDNNDLQAKNYDKWLFCQKNYFISF